MRRLCSGYLPQNCTIYIDNFFNSISLLEKLREENIHVIGTIRSDRVEKAPLREIKKESRGTFHVLHDETSKITLIRWNDNSQVTMATNLEKDKCEGLSYCKRWSKAKREKISVPMPNIIKEYNRSMGGVDLFDRIRGLYRIRIRNKRWH